MQMHKIEAGILIGGGKRMRSLKGIHIVGAVFTLIVGTLLHFVWEWSGYSNLTAVFSAVNESTWEHLKLLFFPFILFSAIEYGLYGKHRDCFFTAKARAVLLGMLTIVVVFYTYTGILGKNYFLLDIGTFLLGVAASYLYSYQYLRDFLNTCTPGTEIFSLFIILILAVAFGVFTFYPPALGLFVSPV